jgi:hypothetical protein
MRDTDTTDRYSLQHTLFQLAILDRRLVLDRLGVQRAILDNTCHTRLVKGQGTYQMALRVR